MSMHLHHPSLSLNGKRRGKFKFASAEAKRKSEQLEKEWQDLQKKWGVEPEDKKRKRSTTTLVSTNQNTYKRDTGPRIPSLGDGIGVAVAKPQQMYTGDKMKGIGTMHKSNAVPIFSDLEAKEISSMRR